MTDQRSTLTAPEFARSGEYPVPGGTPGREGLRVEPPSTGSRRRLPELILGILLVAGSALAAVLLAVSGRSRTDAVALSADLRRGEVIERDDLTTAQIGTDGDVAYVAASDLDELVGRVALTDLTDGTLVTPDMLGSPVEMVEAGEAQVGVVLDMSQMPSLGLAVGDVVNVVVDVTGDPPQAQVAAVEQLDQSSGQQERWYVSLQADESQVNQIATAFAGDSNIHLVLVGE